MKTVVFIKQVPDSTAEIAVEEGKVVLGDALLVINPWDEIAIEAALQQQEMHGGEILAITVGKRDETEGLKYAMAMGVDDTLLVTDPLLGDVDSQAAAMVMAAAVKKVGDVQMAFFGRQTIDNEAGVTAAQAARVLGWPLLSLVSSIIETDLEGGTVTVEQSTDEGKRVVKTRLPVVMNFGRDFSEPRFPSFMRKRKAAKAVIPDWDLAALGLEEPHVVVDCLEAMLVPQPEFEIEFITGSETGDIAKVLADKIKEAIDS